MRILFIFLCFSSRLFSQAWVQIADFPSTKRDDRVAVFLDGKIYVGSGLQEGWGLPNDFYSLDVASNTWTSIASMPAGAERQYACAFAGPSSFYIFGGFKDAALNSMIKYDRVSNSWSKAPSKPGNGLTAALCFSFGDKVIIVGGKIAENGPVSDEVWEYRISNSTWTKKNEFPFGGRWRAAGAVLNGFGYLLFGRDENGSWRKEMYKYDPQNDAWQKMMDLPQSQSRWYTAVQAAGNKLVMFGGYDTLDTYYNETWLYFDTENRWEKSVDMPSFGRKGGMSCVSGNNFYYFCGIQKNNDRLNQSWVFTVPLGLREEKFGAQLKVYPNPATDYLRFDSEASQIEVTNVYGERFVVPFERSESSTTIDLRTLAGGYYLLRVKTASGSFIKKFVKDP